MTLVTVAVGYSRVNAFPASPLLTLSSANGRTGVGWAVNDESAVRAREATGAIN
ncbi:hypothetical protein [Dietzia sp. CH92]|uniref:hypothetical protein n=1 Tax=Dietzia sp. CH92 TaxID=3051823 RepID=UPI0028D8947E|nr:hypothetical protein [Dietzia sp. CH92]